MKSGVWFGALALLAACSSFSASGDPDNGVGPDGRLPDGGLPPVTGTFTGEVELTVTVSPVVRNRTAKVAFAVKRGFNYAAPVIVRFEGLPSTITSEPLLLESAASTGELVLTVGKDTPLGPLRGPKLVAVGQTDDKPTHSTPFEPDVRGAPGDLDLSFGMGGVLTVGDSARGSQFDVDALGRIVVLTDTSVRRFDADGHAEDQAFIKRSFLNGPALTLGHRGTSIFLGRNKPAGDPDANGSTAGGELWKLNGDGSLVTSFGTAGVARVSLDDNSACEVDTDGSALAFNPPYTDAITAPAQTNFSPTGVMIHTATSKATKPGYVRGIAILPDHSAVFAGDQTAAKFKQDRATVDTSFGTNGYYSFEPTLHINDLLRDGAGRFLVTGHLDNGSLYLGRLDATGNADTSFKPQTTSFRVKTESLAFAAWSSGLPITVTRSFAGKLAMGTDGKIYQAGQVEADGSTRCVVARYLADGSPDVDFGDGGSVTLPQSGCYAHRIVRQRDGFVLVGGPILLRVWQ